MKRSHAAPDPKTQDRGMSFYALFALSSIHVRAGEERHCAQPPHGRRKAVSVARCPQGKAPRTHLQPRRGAGAAALRRAARRLGVLLSRRRLAARGSRRPRRRARPAGDRAGRPQRRLGGAAVLQGGARRRPARAGGGRSRPRRRPGEPPLPARRIPRRLQEPLQTAHGSGAGEAERRRGGELGGESRSSAPDCTS